MFEIRFSRPLKDLSLLANLHLLVLFQRDLLGSLLCFLTKGLIFLT